jgi:hypothetical protein
MMKSPLHTHAETTAEGLATWIERRKHTPDELRLVLGYALKDAEARGEERGERLASLEAPPDPAPEEAAPLNAHVGRRMPVVRLVEGPLARKIDLRGLRFYGDKK